MMSLLLFGVDSWVLSDVMMRMVESTYVWFLHQITGKMERQKHEGFWETVDINEVLGVGGMQSAATYIVHWKSRV